MLARLTTALADRYRIERELGAGGMALVYLAHDIRHDRPVAVKVVRPELSALLGAERFLNEIKVTANLQHPHILPLYDSGSADGLLYYVMPYVEGESLRGRLNREKQLGIEEAVRLAGQVASALDYAHRHGVIHRDIKPENILLHDGQALVADFGIALAVRAAGGARLTETGLSLGTPQYMSPEQATADRELDARSDVYSLGAVVYEMIAGEPPYTGPTAQSVIAKLMTEPARRLSLARPTVPPGVEAAIHKSLQRLPADRFASADQFADALRRPVAFGETAAVGAVAAPRSRSRVMVAVAALGWALVVGLTAMFLRGGRGGKTPDQPVRRYDIVLPDSAPLDFFGPSLFGDGLPALAISPDGSTLVYVARRGTGTQLYRRSLQRRTVEPIPGTEGAAQPFFSPDGTRIAFAAGGEIRAVPLTGGGAVALARVQGVYGATWTAENRIVLGGYSGFLDEVSGSGGEVSHFASFSFLFPNATAGPGQVVAMRADGLVALLRRGSKPRFLRPPGPGPADSSAGFLQGFYPRATSCGHLAWLTGNTLTAASFDPFGPGLTGSAASVEQGVRRELQAGQFVVGPDGTLIYAPGADGSQGALVWTDRTGRVLDTIPIPRSRHHSISAAPSGDWIATSGLTPSGRITSTLVNVARGIESHPSAAGYVDAWWPDGRRAVITNLYPPQSLAVATEGEARQDSLLGPGWLVTAVSRVGGYVAGLDTSHVLWLVPQDSSSRRYRVGPSTLYASFSPDGRWIAYIAPQDVAGRVSPVPPTGETYPISPPGIDQPEWSPKGDEIFYRVGNRWMTVPVSTNGGVFRAETPRLLFERRFLQAGRKSYGVGPDGRFLLIQGPTEETTTRLHVVTNFCSELRRLAPPTR